MLPATLRRREENGEPAENALQKLWGERIEELMLVLKDVYQKHPDLSSSDAETARLARDVLLEELRDFQDTDAFIELSPADATKYSEWIQWMQEGEGVVVLLGSGFKEVDIRLPGRKESLPTNALMIVTLAYLRKIGEEELDAKRKLQFLHSLPTNGTLGWWQLVCSVLEKSERTNARAVFIPDEVRAINIKRAECIRLVMDYLKNTDNIALRKDAEAALADFDDGDTIRSLFEKVFTAIDTNCVLKVNDPALMSDVAREDVGAAKAKSRVANRRTRNRRAR